MERRLAIIPARIGSKRIPMKNIRDFCGRPMITYILKTARKSGLFSKIHVSTESKGVVDIVEANGFTVDFMRPDNLSDDFTPLIPVLKFVLEKYKSLGQNFDQVWLLMACAPLIVPADLIEAEKLFRQHNSLQTVLSVTEYPVPVEWSFTSDAANRLEPVFPGKFALRSQDFEKKYFDAGVFAVYPAKTIEESIGSGTDKGLVAFPISKLKAVDIDTEDDWKLAEAIYKVSKPKRQ